MTVLVTENKVFADGNDVATVFSFNPVRINAENDLLVILIDPDGIEGDPLQLGVDYSTSPVGDKYPDTGSVTYPLSGDPLPTGWQILMYRNTEQLQKTRLENQGGYNPKVQEQTFDISRMVDQDQEERIGRVLTVSVGAPAGFDGTFKAIPDTAPFISSDGLSVENVTRAELKGETGATGPKGDPGNMDGSNNLDEIALDGKATGGNPATARRNIAVPWSGQKTNLPDAYVVHPGNATTASDVGQSLYWVPNGAAFTTQLAAATDGWQQGDTVALTLFGSGTLEISAADGKLVNGQSSLLLSQNRQSVKLYYAGTEWYAVAESNKFANAMHTPSNCLRVGNATTIQLRPLGNAYLQIEDQLIGFNAGYTTMDNSGLVAFGWYYVYAYPDTPGSLKLKSSTTAPQLGAFGYPTEGGNERTHFVGVIGTQAGTQFTNSLNERLVYSHYADDDFDGHGLEGSTTDIALPTSWLLVPDTALVAIGVPGMEFTAEAMATVRSEGDTYGLGLSVNGANPTGNNRAYGREEAGVWEPVTLTCTPYRASSVGRYLFQLAGYSVAGLAKINDSAIPTSGGGPRLTIRRKRPAFWIF